MDRTWDLVDELIKAASNHTDPGPERAWGKKKGQEAADRNDTKTLYRIVRGTDQYS